MSQGFHYVHRKEWYLTLVEGRDVIEDAVEGI
jgi:predicted nucleotidyltransferase